MRRPGLQSAFPRQEKFNGFRTDLAALPDKGANRIRSPFVFRGFAGVQEGRLIRRFPLDGRGYETRARQAS